MILFGIKNCDTVKKARNWLEQNEASYTFHDFRVDGLTDAMIASWLQQVSWEALLNKRSTTWRQLDDAIKANIDETKAIELMLAHPTLIKRPVLVKDNTVLIGFNTEHYQQII